jgi:hypothetical protein
MCSTIYIVPDDSAASAQQPESASEPRWYMKTPEGQVYGPVDQDVLQRWSSEGRISADCELRTDQASWRPAGEYLGSLPAGRTGGATASASSSSVNPFADQDSPAVWASVPDGFRPATSPGSQVPHRGVLILVLGILGWAFSCVPLGVIAWVMGNSDLWEMECGRMDQTGRGLTQAGRILGMVQTLLCLVVFLVGIFVVVFIGLVSA